MNTSDPASLQNLHDIISPHVVAWLPPAPGWYALGLSIFLLCSWFSVHKYMLWKRNKYRREALIELAVIQKQLADGAGYQQFLPQLAELVKRTAIAAYGRNLVASLTGNDWRGFLDTTGATHLFTTGDGRLLQDCSYQPAARLANFSDEQVAGLQKAVFYWIQKHHPKTQNKL